MTGTPMERILLCTDLDRTLLPNGLQPESPGARALLGEICRRPEVTFAFVSGRDRGLLRDAIDEYQLPLPDYAIGDVGTTIYAAGKGSWMAQQRWHDEIADDWAGHGQADLERMIAPVTDLFSLRLQEPEKQAAFKLSYYARPDINRPELFERIHARLRRAGVKANLTWSVDETRAEGLLDILPASADKLHAIRFLMRELDFTEKNTIFAGDSGNDLPVLASGIASVLVANATEQVKFEARTLAAQAPQARLYVAKGANGMNGNYAAGIIEGLNHYFPQTRSWLGRIA